MIQSVGSKETEKIRDGIRSAKLPNEIQQVARRKLRMLNSSVSLADLRIPPSNRLEKLSGDLKDYYSIRINDQWRIMFKWKDGHSFEVEIIDYHKS
jgi:proteic killer suppression protein